MLQYIAIQLRARRSEKDGQRDAGRDPHKSGHEYPPKADPRLRTPRPA